MTCELYCCIFTYLRMIVVALNTFLSLRIGTQAEVLDDPTLTVEGAQLLIKNGAAACVVLVRESSLQKIVVKVCCFLYMCF
jgi:hypothetical protein